MSRILKVGQINLKESPETNPYRCILEFSIQLENK